MSTRKRVVAGAGLSIGAALAAPTAAQADDFTVTNLNNSGGGSLREAIEDADANSGADRILFASSLSGTITLTSGELAVNDALEIVGPGASQLIVSGGDDSRVFRVYDDTTIRRLTIADGNSGVGASGGAIVAGSGDLTLIDSVVSGSTAGNDGGGIYAYPGGLRVENSTIAGNDAVDSGGGIYSYEEDVEIVNSTISGNGAADGGGIFVAKGTITLASTTVAGNTAGDDGGGIGANIPNVDLSGSIVANNTPDDLFDFGAAGWAGAFNLVEDPGNSLLPATGNTFGTDPNLGALKDNGGPTPTHALGKGSAAKDAGPGDAPATDQRGAPRKGKADIGAYELVKCGGATVDVVGTPGKDRLRGDGGRNGILGLGGKDRLVGVQNRDGLCGGGGKDKLAGGNGRDKLRGGGGKDVLKGGKASDKLNGGPGNDKCVGGGGPGFDKLKSC